MCHTHTQQLVREGPKPPEGKGGAKRKPAIQKQINKKVKELLPPAAVEFTPDPEPDIELRNACPKCHAIYKATDVYCRKDGTKLCIGKSCPRCFAPAEELDAFCWQCSWNLAEIPPPNLNPEPNPLPSWQSPSPTLDLPPGHIDRSAILDLPPFEETIASPAPSLPAEDPIVRLLREAKAKGLIPVLHTGT
jgi:hypothetical protein